MEIIAHERHEIQRFVVKIGEYHFIGDYRPSPRHFGNGFFVGDILELEPSYGKEGIQVYDLSELESYKSKVQELGKPLESDPELLGLLEGFLQQVKPREV